MSHKGSLVGIRVFFIISFNFTEYLNVFIVKCQNIIKTINKLLYSQSPVTV